tara:strand:+ start:4361 stop:5884 length:1524 start_codon:yes stop_codon:yes gene_type:complete
MSSSLKIINEIEHSTDVEDWKYSNIYLWPLYRFYIHEKLREESTKINLQKKFRIQVLFKSIFNLKNIFKAIYSILNSSKKEVVFLTNSSFKRFQNKNKWFDPYCYPVIDDLNKLKITSDVLELDLLGDGSRGNGTISSIKIQSLIDFLYFFLMPLYAIKFYFSLLFMPISIKNRFSSKLNKILAKKEIDLVLPKDHFFFKQLINIKIKALIYKVILKRFNTRIGVMVGYGSQDGLSFCLACRYLNIRSIELQHGMISEEMPRYAKWSKVPKNGYELMPKIFWCWSQSERDHIYDWIDHKSFNRVEINGNIFLENYSEYIDNQSTKIQENLAKKTKNYHKIILVALQHKEWEPDWLFNEISRFDKEVFWLLRFHPADKNKSNRITELEAFFNSINFINYDIRYINDPSMNILNSIDISHGVVSAFSSSLIEATFLRKEVGIIHKEGINHLRRYIDDKLMYSAYSPELFKNFVQQVLEQDFLANNYKTNKASDGLYRIRNLFKDKEIKD